MNIYFDIGANIGNYSNYIFSSKKVDKMICVEANPNLIQHIKNALLIYSNRVEIINKAVSPIENNIDFHICNACFDISTCDLFWKNESRFSKKSGMDYAVSDSSWSTIKVETISIDKLIELYGIPTHIKIDVEGYELNVVKSMTKFYGCPVSFEWAEEKLDDVINTIKYLNELGYQKFSLQYTDKFDHEILLEDYKPCDNFIEEFKNECVVTRFEKWGMIHCI